MNYRKDRNHWVIAVILIMITASSLSSLIQSNSKVSPTNSQDYVSISPFDDQSSSNPPISIPSLSLQSFQTPSILFIVGDPTNLDPNHDIAFYNYLTTTLSYTVEYHDDNGSYNTDNYDAILISDSVLEEGPLDPLINVTVPILSMEVGSFNEFGFGAGITAPSSVTTVYVRNISHYITQNEIIGDLQIYNTGGSVSSLTGYNNPTSGGQVYGFVQSKANANNQRIITTIDKGKNNWYVNPVPERRAFFGATNGTGLNQNGWNLWNRTIRWILYDDDVGNATIRVNVKDFAKTDVQGARVDLNNSYIPTINQTAITDASGNVTFPNIPFGYYNITVHFQGETNDTLKFLEIAGLYTYNRTVFKEYVVGLSSFDDQTPPTIENVTYSATSISADLFDLNSLSFVYLNLTAINSTGANNPGATELTARNYSMVLSSGNRYFNDSWRNDLTHSNVEVFFNIIANDSADNWALTATNSFILSDAAAPFIHDYNVTDYGNGTLQFYANISDSSQIIGTTLKINNTLYSMVENATGYWVYITQIPWNRYITFTIYSVNDSFLNENGTKIGSINPADSISTTTEDTQGPRIYGVTDSGTSHMFGYVEFSAFIDDTDQALQSGVNASSAQIIIDFNNGTIIPEQLTFVPFVTFIFNYTFTVGDDVTYWIRAADFAGNKFNVTNQFIVGDNEIPIVTYSATDWGNGTVDFFAYVTDWPVNDTSAYILFTQNYPTFSNNISMNKVSPTNFSYRHVFSILQDVWYYVAAFDDGNNSNNPTIAQAFLLPLQDNVSPIVSFTIYNSTTNDGKITIEANATDGFGAEALVSNTFYVNITTQTGTTMSPMVQTAVFFIYQFTQTFSFNEQITITVWVNDSFGNIGNATRSITILDYAPPHINNWDSIIFQNGSVAIWADVNEEPTGSGMAGENSVLLEYIYIQTITVSMIWNGTVYSYTISGFLPGNAFTFRITAKDNIGNTNTTAWQAIVIADLTSPMFIGYDSDEKLVNHTSVQISFWIEATDEFGSVKLVNITLNQLSGSLWINQTFTMTYNSSHYFFITYMICNRTYEYRMVIFDEWINTNSTPLIQGRALDFLPATVLDYGIEYNSERAGNATIWMIVNNPFNDHTAYISIFNNDTREWLVFQALMKSNVTHMIYEVHFEGEHIYTYLIELFDSGVITGFYEASRYPATIQITDFWEPTIHQIGFNRINGSTLLFWANVSDWGVNTSSILVFVYYGFTPLENTLGGYGTSLQKTQLSYNGSLFSGAVKFPKSGSIEWYIEVSHQQSTPAQSEMGDIPFVFQSNLPNIGLGLPQLIAIVIGPILVGGIIIISTFTIQRRKRVRVQKSKDYRERLSAISNIYTVLVSTEAGIPLFNITNTLYRRDESLNVALSGLSVGMSDFLESFQSQFVEQLDQSPESRPDLSDDRLFRLSLIEQHKIQILIAASPSFRIFVYLRKKPSNYLRNIFSQAVRKLEDKLYLEDLGVVDEHLVEPHVRSIIDSLIPLTLLQQFTIETVRLMNVDSQIKEGRIIQFSRAAVNALKRLYVIQTTSLSSSKNGIADPNLFDKIVREQGQRSNTGILYNDAIRVLMNLLKISPEEVYEALWTGSSSQIRIIVPFEL